MAEKIKPVDMLQQFKEDMSIYSITANIRRSIPGTDGLKLVHRRIIYAIKFLMHVGYNRKHVKSAAIVGEVLKELHPHGDSSVYEAMVKLGNWFESYMLLIDKQGSFGTFQGYPAAAARYTEARLTEFCCECVIGELDEIPDIVDYIPNYDNTSKEPEIFPVRVPLPLINGMNGIGVGCKVYVPNHNLVEVINETIKVIEDPSHRVFLIPDQCQSCIIVGDQFEKISHGYTESGTPDGVGSYRVRGIIDTEDNGKNINLVIKSCPDQVVLQSIITKLEDLVKENKIIGIVDIIDESSIAKRPKDPDIMRLVIKLKPGSDPVYITETIYQLTDMEKSYSVSFELIDGVEKVRFNYDSYIRYFIDKRVITKFRYYKNKLSIASTKYHNLEAFVKVLKSGEIENIIRMIRNNKDKDYEVLTEFLIKKCKITDLQAKYILRSRISHLSKGKLHEYEEEIKLLNEEINRYRSMITNEELIKSEIIEELKYFAEKYGTPRRSKVLKGKKFSMIPTGRFSIVIDQNNYIRKINLDDQKSNKYGSCKFYIDVDNDDTIILFDNMGRCFPYEVHKLPLMDRNSAGIDIKSIIKSATSDIITVLSKSHLEKLEKIKSRGNSVFKLLITTNTGVSKRIDLSGIINSPTKSGLIYTKLIDGNYVSRVTPISNNTDVFVFNKNKCLRLISDNIPEMKRNAFGSKTIVPNMMGISYGDPKSEMLFVLTMQGKYNLILNDSLKYGNKNTQGTKIIGSGDIISVIPVNIDDVIIVETTNGNREFPISQLNQGSTISSGSVLLPTKQNPIINVFKK